MALEEIKNTKDRSFITLSSTPPSNEKQSIVNQQISTDTVKKETSAPPNRSNFLKRVAERLYGPTFALGLVAMAATVPAGLVVGTCVGGIVKMLPKKAIKAFAHATEKSGVEEKRIVGSTARLGMQVGSSIALYASTALFDYSKDNKISKFMDSGIFS